MPVLPLLLLLLLLLLFDEEVIGTPWLPWRVTKTAPSVPAPWRLLVCTVTCGTRDRHCPQRQHMMCCFCWTIKAAASGSTSRSMSADNLTCVHTLCARSAYISGLTALVQQ
jgi:hypothetical protein